MPLPLILGIAAAIAGGTGIGLGIKGGKDMYDANDTLSRAKRRNEENILRHARTEEQSIKAMDDLGFVELNAIKSLQRFQNLFAKIHNKPRFEEIMSAKVEIEPFTPKALTDATIGASVLSSALGSAALGTAGGFAASGATTAAVMALGSASTGTLISSLSGAAATNATLAALGGGSLAAGGGGMALGATILGASSLGVGLLIGGVIFSLKGSSVSKKADDAHRQMLENERKINEICHYLDSLKSIASSYLSTLRKVIRCYDQYVNKMAYVIEVAHADSLNWNLFSDDEKKIVENTVLLVGVIYNMCKVKLVLANDSSNQVNDINRAAINNAKKMAESTLQSVNYGTTGAWQAPNLSVDTFKSIFRLAIKNERGNRVLFDWDKVLEIVNRSTGRQYSKNKLRELVPNFGRKDHVNLSAVAKQIGEIMSM